MHEANDIMMNIERQHMFIGDDNGNSSFMHFWDSNPE